MRITTETLKWFSYHGQELITKKIVIFINQHSDNNPEDEAGVIFLQSFLALRELKEECYKEWLDIIIPVLTGLDNLDYFGPDGWEHHAGLGD